MKFDHLLLKRVGHTGWQTVFLSARWVYWVYVFWSSVAFCPGPKGWSNLNHWEDQVQQIMYLKYLSKGVNSHKPKVLNTGNSSNIRLNKPTCKTSYGWKITKNENIIKVTQKCINIFIKSARKFNCKNRTLMKEIYQLFTGRSYMYLKTSSFQTQPLFDQPKYIWPYLSGHQTAHTTFVYTDYNKRLYFEYHRD